MTSTESGQEHEFHRPLDNFQPSTVVSIDASHRASGNKNMGEVISGIVRQLEALDEECRENTAALNGQVCDEDQAGPPMSASSFPDTGPRGDNDPQFHQLAAKMAASLEGLQVTGQQMKSATRQLSSGVQQFKGVMKEMKTGFSHFKVSGKDKA